MGDIPPFKILFVSCFSLCLATYGYFSYVLIGLDHTFQDERVTSYPDFVRLAGKPPTTDTETGAARWPGYRIPGWGLIAYTSDGNFNEKTQVISAIYAHRFRTLGFYIGCSIRPFQENKSYLAFLAWDSCKLNGVTI
jgi:hypothetical protein